MSPHGQAQQDAEMVDQIVERFSPVLLALAASDQEGADAERALARFGAAVVGRKFVDGMGFDPMRGDDLDDESARAGVVDGELCRALATGIAEAVVRLTGGDA